MLGYDEGSVSFVVDTVHCALASRADAAVSLHTRKTFGGGESSKKGKFLQECSPVAQRNTADNSVCCDDARASKEAARLAVVRVSIGREHAAAERTRKVAGAAALDVFVLMREVARRSSGIWTTERGVAYPGCVFVATNDADMLQERLSASILHGMQLIESHDTVSFLSDEEAAFVRDLGGVDHVIHMSVGDIVAGRLIVRSGSLAGHEGLVAHVDRHRRSAWLSTDAPARGLRVGLEVVSKS